MLRRSIIFWASRHYGRSLLLGRGWHRDSREACLKALEVL
jgi:hypothetical protein